MTRIVTFAAAAVLLCCLPAGCCQQCWQQAKLVELVPPHSRFHPVPTEPVFGTRRNPAMAGGNVSLPDPGRTGIVHPSGPALQHPSVPYDMSLDGLPSTTEEIPATDLQFESSFAPQSEPELQMVPELPPLEELDDPIDDVRWQVPDADAGGGSGYRGSYEPDAVPLTPTANRLHGWQPRSSPFREAKF